MEGGEEEGKQKNNNISKSEKPEKKNSSEEMDDDECECSPLQSPLHTLDDDDDDDPPLKKEKPFFHRPLPKLLHPPPYLLDRQPQPQPQRQPPPPPIDPHQSMTAISIMNPHQPTTAMVSMDRKPYQFSPVRSPPLEKMNLPHTVSPPSETVTVKPQSSVFVVNRPIREELMSSGVSKMNDDDHRQDSNGDVEDGVGGGNRKLKAALPSVFSRRRKEDMVKRAALGFRVCAVVFCLVSFSVMAADKTQGWAGDSFDRYKEYRYCISVTIIGFVYASFQAYDLAYNLITEKHIIPYYIRYYFDFSMDQILTYLLISASSSAATRVDDWQTNWGKDEFTIMASASVGMSFMAFVAFAFSSLISGYNLCMRNYNN